MKILHLPLNVPGSEQVGQERGFREVFGDENYRQFDYLVLEGQLGKNGVNDALKATIADFRPNIIWAQLQETDAILPETWEHIRQSQPDVWLTCWSGDARDYVPAGMQQWLKHFDIFYNDTDQIDLYGPYCNRYEFMPIAVDPIEGTDYSHPTPKVPEVVFIGNDYGQNFSNGPFRKQLMMALTREFGDRFGVFGTGWDQSQVNVLGSCPVKHQGAYYHKARVVVSVDHIKGILHWSERLIWAMMSGSAVVMEDQRGLEKHSSIHPFVETFSQGSLDGAVAAVHKLLTLYSELSGEEIPQAAAKDAALRWHTWKQRAEQVKKDYEVRPQSVG